MATAETDRQIHEQLGKGDFASLEARFAALHVAFASGKSDDVPLTTAYGVFKANDLLQLEAWQQARPDSMIPLYAKAQAYLDAAWEARGKKFISKTSDEQLQKMRDAHKQAMDYLQEAARLDDDPFLLHVNVLRLAQHYGDDGREKYLAEIRRFPGMLKMYQLAVLSERPQWGGEGVAGMNFFVDLARKNRLPSEWIKSLQAEVADQQRWQAAQDKDKEGQLRHALAALQLCEDKDSLASAFSVAYELERYDLSAELAERYYPYPTVGDQRGLLYKFAYANAYADKPNFGRARHYYEAADALGSSMAANNLGVMYRDGRGMPRDLDKARTLFEKAAATGNQKAQENLKKLNESVRAASN
ncbi:tetratricopeptide repeat protein [Chitinilyticum litopenaei]|uniref:tetratricopeptide repeat protein n=1 Tax=Chitinilyticum litopenaei TaxID=1121276 RepID=UPI00118586C8|nr:DUF4034 domain-containing protein [Chitinilyticum litopenaei]